MKQNLLFNQASALGKRLAMVLTMLLTIGIGTMLGATVTYTVSSTTSVTKSGTAPIDATASYNQTYSTAKQLTKNNSATLTLTNLGGINISNLTLSMKSNSSSGSGKLSYSIDGGSTWTYLVGSSSSGSAFSNANWNGKYTTSYTDISKDVTINNATQLKIKIEATASSLYCESYTITYTDATPKQEYKLSYQAGESSGILQVEEGANLLDVLGELGTPTSCDATSTTFVGWTATKITEKTNTAPTFITSTYVMPSSDYAVFAVFAENSGGASFDGTTGGNFKIYAIVNGTKYYAKGTGSKISSTTEESDATEYTFAKTSTGFTIKTGTSYITYSSSTNLGTSTTAYNWDISEGTNGSWRIASVASTSRGIVFRAGSSYNQFGGYALSNVSAGSKEYFDVEIGSSPSYSNFITSCTTQTVVTLDPNGGAISEDGWELVDGLYKQTTTESNIILPTITKGNWTFAGWDEDEDGEGDYGGEASIELNGTAVILSALWECSTLPEPTGLRAIPTSDGGIISWNQVTNATGYEISTDGGETWGLFINGGSTTSHTLKNRECETTIEWQVRAVGNMGNGYCEENPAASYSFTTLECGCPSYSFHYGIEGQSDWEIKCFEQAGADDPKYILPELFTMPNTGTHNYYVGYQGNFYNDNLGYIGQSKSENVGLQYMRLTQPMANGGEVYLGTDAVGATGTVVIYDNSQDNNLAGSFDPSGYGIKVGDTWNAFSLPDPNSPTVWETTDILTMPGTDTEYQTGIATAASYVPVSNSSSKALNTMAVSSKEQGKKVIWFVPNNNWNTDNARYAVYFFVKVNGTTKEKWVSMTKIGNNLYKCLVPTDNAYEQMIFCRMNPGSATNSWDTKWNQSGDLDIPGGLATKYTLNSNTQWDGFTDNLWSIHTPPSQGQQGKYRMWSDNASSNFSAHWIPWYVLTYDKNATDATGSTEVTAISSEAASYSVTTNSCGFTRTGYDFVNWQTQPNGGTAYSAGATYTLSADATLYAQWTPKNITIIWDANGGSVSPTTSTYTYNGTPVELPIPARANYIFNGWFTATTGGTKITEVGTTNKPTEDVTYYAQWTEKATPTFAWSAATCTAALEADNTFPTLSNPNTLPVTYTSSNTDVATIDANGNITLVATGRTTITADGAETATHKSATTTYELTVVESNCKWVEVEIGDIDENDQVVIAMAKTDGTKTWALDNSATGTYPTAGALLVEGNKISQPLDKYIWNIVATPEGYVLYSYADKTTWLYCTGSNNTVKVGTGSDKKFVIENGYLKCSNQLTVSGQLVDAYIGVSSNTNSWRHYSNTTGVIKDQTLKFYKRECLDSEHYWVTWDANEGTWTDGSSNKLESYQVGATITEPTDPTREGYRFDGWTPAPTTMPAQNTTFTAVWTQMHTITWMVGSNSVLTEEVANETGVTKTPADPANNAIGDCANAFMGWSETPLGSTEGQSAPADLCTAAQMKANHTSVTGDKTFYAVFATKEGGEDYLQISNESDLVAGSKYLIVGNSSSTYRALPVDNASNLTYVNPSSSKISNPADGLIWTLEGAADRWKIKSTYNNKYLQISGGNLTFVESTALTFNVSVSSSKFTFTSSASSGNKVLSYYHNGDCFNAYNSANTVYIYKQDVSYSNYVTQCCTPWTAPTLSATTTSIAVGGSTTITHSGTTHGAVTYTSNDNAIATVDANGVVTGLKPGKATITATWNGVDGVNNYCPAEATIDITVTGSFTITYDANHASATGTTASTIIAYPDGTGTVATNGFALNGHEFVKWNTKNGTSYNAGDAITLTDDITLYAIWQPNQYDITVNVVGGSITLGTTTITTANTPQTITDVVAHGQSFSFTNATPDAAYETPYAVTLVNGTAEVTSNSLTISNVQSDLEITIEYTLKPVYTITYNIPEDGGELAADAVTSIYKGGSITLPGIKDGTISSEYSCEEFIGWTTNPANHEAAGLKPEPFYNTGASFLDVSEDVTFYPVYSRPGAGVGGTVTLTEEEMYDWEDAGYGTPPRNLTTCVGTWTTTGYKNGSHAIQLKSDGSPYVKFPDLSGNITQVVLNATNGSDATLTSGTFTLKTEGGTTIASASVNGSGICTIPVTGSYTTAYLYSSATARITNIAITYGPPAIISTTLDCSSDVDECTITYDSNESFLISGASVYGSCTNSTFRFSVIGEYTICSNIRANQYVLVGWNNQCDGKGSLTYTPGQVITSLPQNNLTLYAQWAPVVSLNDAGSVSEVNATTFGGAVALPDGEKGCDPYEFVGWTTVYPSWNEESILPTIVDNPYTPTEPTTLYAVYTQRATSPDFTANCNGGVYKIWVNNSANNHMSGQINSSNNLYTVEYWDASYSEANKTPFTITKIGENTYTIQNADGHYITRHYSDNKLAIETTWDNLDRYKWTISAGTNGSWRFTNKAATTYALIYYNNYFRLYSANNVTNGSTLYYDLELTPVESAVYYSAPSCGDYAIHFYTHGGEFVQGDYAYPTAVTEGLNGTVETKFPSATLNGYTFVGWKENAPQDELTDNSPEGDTSAEPYGLKKPGDDLITTTRREFHAVYYYYDELQDVDLSGPITTSIFAENNAGELRFLSGTPSNNPGTLSSTTACGDVAVVKITPGTGENTGKYTININGYNIIPQSGEAPGVERGTAWWYIEETSTGSGEYKIYVQNGRNIVLNGVSFGNYAYNAQGSYNGDYHYVRFGNCREHHWASDPKRKPSIILSSSGPLTITSSAGQTIKSINKLFVGATRYETQTKIYLTCDVDGVGLLHEDGTALSSDANGEYLTTTAEGELATTYLILTYTPTATTDGIETVTITAQDEEGTAKATRLAQVRHLPENFVIAAKTGNSWVALNANITSTGTQAAPLIMVDNIALPTKATITPNTTKYQLLGLQTDKPSIANSRFKNNGAAVHLYSTNVSKVISASTSTDNNKTYINADAAHEGAANSPNCLFYEWQLQTNDLVHYTLVNSNTTNTSNTKLGYSATYAQWGMYQTGNNVIQEVLLLPIEKDITEMDVEVMEWGTNSMALRFGSEAPATVDITLGATTTKGLSLANLNSGNTSDIYKVEGLSLAGNDCEALLITDATDASKGKLIRKPILVNGEKNGSDYTNSPTRDVCMHSDIVILNGGKLTADEAKTVGSHVDFANIYVYPGGKLVLDGNSLGVKRQVYLRGGYSWLNPTTYALPEVFVNGEINFNGSGKMIYDYYIQNQKYYQFALPYDVQLANVTDESGADDFPVWVKHYNGALRAEDAYATSWEWYPSENGDANAYFEAGIGYIIAAKPRQVGNVANRPLSIIRFPLGNSAFTGGEGDKSVATTAHGIEGYKAGTVTANNVGWNFIGNPFMATWKGNIGHKELAKHPDEDNWDGSYHWVDSDVKFITIMSPEDGSDYEQTIAANADLNPFFPFYLQETAEGGSGEIAFSSDNRIKKAPALWNVEQDEREAYIQIEIAMDAVADQTGVFVSNKYSDEIDFDDYEKMFGSSTDKPKVWLVHDNTRLAFEAMTENRATGMTPLGYRAPQDGEYMLVLNDEVSQLDNVESIYLTDYETGVTDYDLTSSAYEFESTTTLYNDTRFAIRVVMRDNTQGSVTAVDNVGTGDEQIHKFIYQDKIYILHHGVIYDATGKRVVTINK